jgi:hypothetical protein
MIFGAGGAAVAAPPATPPAAAASAADQTDVTSAVTGTTADGSTFAGTFAPSSFQAQDGVLTVTGLVSGTLTSATGAVMDIPATEVTTTVQNANALAGSGATTLAAPAAACDIVNLDLGPLDLNVLGLQIDLNQILLDITAVPGAGNLVGNLLCAVTGLLDGNGVSGLANLLNRLLGL